VRTSVPVGVEERSRVVLRVCSSAGPRRATVVRIDASSWFAAVCLSAVRLSGMGCRGRTNKCPTTDPDTIATGGRVIRLLDLTDGEVADPVTDENRPWRPLRRALSRLGG